MKNTLSHSENLLSQTGWLQRISGTVKASLMGIGLLATPLATAQEKSTEIRLSDSQQLNQAFLSENSGLKNTITDLWSQLRDAPGAPQEICDQWWNITPEWIQWLKWAIPAEHKNIFDQLQAAQIKATQSPKESLAYQDQMMIIGVCLSLLIAFTLWAKKMVKDGKKEAVEKAINELEEKYKALEQKFSWNIQDNESIDPVSPEAEKGITTPETTIDNFSEKIRSLSPGSLCTITKKDGDKAVLYVTMRRTDGFEAFFNWKEYWITLHDNELSFDPGEGKEKIFVPLDDITDISSFMLPQPNQINNSSPDTETDRLQKFGVSRNTITVWQQYLVTTQNSIYILEVAWEEKWSVVYKVMPESPRRGNIWLGTLLSGFNRFWGLQFGESAISPVTSMTLLDGQNSTNEALWVNYTIAPLPDMSTMGLSELNKLQISIQQQAAKRQEEDASRSELGAYVVQIDTVERAINSLK